jgi:hypothetical protein
MLTMYVPGSEIHVHSDYITGNYHTVLEKQHKEVLLYYIMMSETSTVINLNSNQNTKAKHSNNKAFTSS